MSGSTPSPCLQCVRDDSQVDPSGDFQELARLLASREERRAALEGLISEEDWKHFQYLRAQGTFKHRILSHVTDDIDEEELPARSSSDEEEDSEEAYFGEEWICWGSVSESEVRQDIVSKEDYQNWASLERRLDGLLVDLYCALADSPMCPQTHNCVHS